MKHLKEIVITHGEFHALSDGVLARIKVVRVTPSGVTITGDPNDLKAIKRKRT